MKRYIAVRLSGCELFSYATREGWFTTRSRAYGFTDDDDITNCIRSIERQAPGCEITVMAELETP